MKSDTAIVRSYGAVFANFVRHAEAKSLDSEGRAGSGTGWLERRPVREGSRAYTGKESNEIEEVAAGFGVGWRTCRRSTGKRLIRGSSGSSQS